MTLLGIAEIIAQHFLDERWFGFFRTGSILMHSFFIIVFAATRQPYAISLLFFFFMIKVILLLKGARLR